MEYEEEYGIHNATSASVCVRTQKDGSKFEVMPSRSFNDWLNDNRLANDNGRTITIGELNKEYLHRKLDEFIDMQGAKDGSL